MTKLSHIFRRGLSGTYYARLRVPADLVAAFGKKEFICSLKTADKKDAIRRGRAKLDEWLTAFDRTRIRSVLTAADMQGAAVEHYHQELGADLSKRDKRLSPSELDAIRDDAKRNLMERAKSGKLDWENRLERLDHMLDFPVLFDLQGLERKGREIRLKALRSHLAEGELALIKYAADGFIERHRLQITPDSQEYRSLCRSLLRAEIEALTRVAERDSGDYSGAAKDPLLATTTHSKVSFTTFDEIITNQEKLSAKGLGGRKAAATIKKYRTTITQFVEWRKDSRVATVTKPELERWRDELLLDQSRKTVRDKVSCVRTITEWGQRQSDGKLFSVRHPLDMVLLPTVEPGDSAAKTYTVGQAKTILLASRDQSAAHKRWIPWIIAYSGARISEIMQLEKADFFQVKGHWFYAIRVGNGRTTKNNMARNVPVHPALVAEGLIDFIDSAPTGVLFRETRAEQNLRDWIREDVLPDLPAPRPAPNHGFRHLFEDLRRGVMDTEAARYITGRSNKGSAEGYGKSQAMLPALAEMMARFPVFL